MKYMIMMFGGLGESMADRSLEEMQGLGAFMMDLDTELREAGELVAGAGLMDPSQAVTVRYEAGATVVVDGPYAEVKESLAGYWIVDTSRERALEITGRVVAYTQYPMEVRQLMHESIPS